MYTYVYITIRGGVELHRGDVVVHVAAGQKAASGSRAKVAAVLDDIAAAAAIGHQQQTDTAQHTYSYTHLI